MNKPTDYGGDWLGRCGSTLPVFDLLLIAIILSVVVGTGLLLTVKGFILPIEDVQATDSRRLKKELQDLEKLAERKISGVEIPEAGNHSEPNLLRRLRDIGQTADKLSGGNEQVALIQGEILHRVANKEKDELADWAKGLCVAPKPFPNSSGTANPETVSGHLSSLIALGEGRAQVLGLTSYCLYDLLARQLAFWKQRADELCRLDEPTPDPPELPIDAGLGRYLEIGDSLVEYRRHIWRLHGLCTESKKEIIGEDLLRFKYNRHDAFDMSQARVESAKQKIRELTDKYREYRNIYVEGHCDPVGSEEYNYRLSFMRARYVARIIRDHLDAQGLTEGKDYFLNIAGYSWRRQLERAEGESKGVWHARLRRIELGFQRIPKP